MNSEERKEQELADQTIELMESDGLRVADGDATMTYELGHRLRELADDDSTECDQELRTQLVDMLLSLIHI